MDNLSVPSIDINFLSIPHVEKLSIPHMDKGFYSILHIYTFSTCGMDKTNVYILGIDTIVLVYIAYGIFFYISYRKLFCIHYL